MWYRLVKHILFLDAALCIYCGCNLYKVLQNFEQKTGRRKAEGSQDLSLLSEPSAPTHERCGFDGRVPNFRT